MGSPRRTQRGAADSEGTAFGVTGAQHLAATGFFILGIQLLARWSSEVVLRYVADAPLLQVTAEYRRRHQDCGLERVLSSVPDELGPIRARLAELDERTAALLAA